MDGWFRMGGWMDGLECKGGRMDGLERMGGWMDGFRMDELVEHTYRAPPYWKC